MERKWWTLIVVGAATFMLLLDVTIVTVALPEIQRGLHASFSDVQWVVDAYALTLASLLLTAVSRPIDTDDASSSPSDWSSSCSALCWRIRAVAPGVHPSRSAQGVGGAILFWTSSLCWRTAFGARIAAWPLGCGARSPASPSRWALSWVALSLAPLAGAASFRPGRRCTICEAASSPLDAIYRLDAVGLRLGNQKITGGHARDIIEKSPRVRCLP